MIYKKEITIRKTIFVEPDNIPDLPRGTIFANTKPTHKNAKILHDGGLDFRTETLNGLKTIEQLQKENKFLILYKGLKYRYAYTINI